MENNQPTYLTGLNIISNKSSTKNNHSKTIYLSNDLKISPETDTYSSLPHPLDTRNQTVEFLKYSTYRSNLLKTEFLDFLLKEENFSNIDETEKFVRDKIVDNINTINKNESEISKKKEEYKKIVLELNKELNKNFKLKPKIDEENHKKRKAELQQKINDKKNDLSLLEKLYTKEYKKRYLLIQNQKSEVENIKINLKQYEKYNILNKKISIETNKKENLLNDVKTYAEQSREVFASEIDNKMKIYNDLEYEVLILKKNTENIEKNIQKVIDMKNKINELIKEKNEINSNLFEKNKSIKSNNFSKEIDILKNTEMKNIELDVLIKNYNDTQNKMNKLKSDLFNTNQQIVELNKILHGLNDEYKEKKQNNMIKKNKSRNIDKKKISLESKTEEDIFKKNYDEFILRDRFKNLKNKNEELVYLCNTKLNIIILYLKFLFEYSNLIYKSCNNSKLNFNFNLDPEEKYKKIIMDSKFYELIKWDKKIFNKKLTSDADVFKEQKNFMSFAIQIMLNFISAINIIVSNVLNLTCFNTEDLLMKYPYSQFNKNFIIFKEDNSNDKNGNKTGTAVINKESNKFEIINFNNKKNKEIYYEYLNLSKKLFTKKNKILSRNLTDIINNKKYYQSNSENKTLTANQPNKLFEAFIHNKNTHKDLKNSQYINNYPSTTLLSLKRFFDTEGQKQLFNGFKSANKNKKINDRYDNLNQTKIKENSINSSASTKAINKKLSIVQSQKYCTNLSKLRQKYKEKNDLYLSKEYNYEFEPDEQPKIVKKKKLLDINGRKKHVIKFSYDDPQKQLIFERMMDIRNLELFANSANDKSRNNDEKMMQNKFYDIYDKFKQKYFGSHNKINSSGVRNYYFKVNKFNRNSSSNSGITSQSSISNKNINYAKGMKFIRNNSDFFYGAKGSSTQKNKSTIKRKKLPYIQKNNTINNNQNRSVELKTFEG